MKRRPTLRLGEVEEVGEVEADGSRLRNLSGRSAVLGDGPSRMHTEHGRFLREQAHSLSQVSLDELVGDVVLPNQANTWCLDETPDVAIVRASGRGSPTQAAGSAAPAVAPACPRAPECSIDGGQRGTKKQGRHGN